jgi:hypothetical protein
MRGQIVFEWSDVLEVPVADYTETLWNSLRFALRYKLGSLFLPEHEGSHAHEPNCQGTKSVMSHMQFLQRRY